MKDRGFGQVVITKKGEASVVGGHPWIYDTEVTPQGTLEDGAIVEVLSQKGRWLGAGFYNSHSKIRVRLLSRNANDTFDAAFFRRRLQYAWAYRKAVLAPQELSCCRVVFGEADQLPGLTVDRFSNILVTQTLSLGMEQRKGVLFQALYDVLTADGQTIDGIYERNDVAIREREGMAEGTGFFPLTGVPEPAVTETEILENGLRYRVDFAKGQKTGFFLDQKYNRLAVQKLCKGARVLDCFTHTGSFALNAGIAGAQSVIGVDASELAVEQATANARLNGLENKVKFICEDVFELLPRLEEEGERFDVVILDPPAFTKSRSSVKNAVKGYREINLRAMRLVKDGGFLATCSCSHFMTYELFTKTIGQAARNVHKRLRQVEYRTQAPDHPILWSSDESYYLKFYIFQVCSER